MSVINKTNTAGDTRTPTGPSPNAESWQGPPMVTKRSTMGQMIDTTGKAVSHHVIMLDSVIRIQALEQELQDLTCYKDIQMVLCELVVRQAKTYAPLQDNRIRTPEVAELQEYLDFFQEFCTNMLSNMERSLPCP